MSKQLIEEKLKELDDLMAIYNLGQKAKRMITNITRQSLTEVYEKGLDAGEKKGLLYAIKKLEEI